MTEYIADDRDDPNEFELAILHWAKEHPEAANAILDEKAAVIAINKNLPIVRMLIELSDGSKSNAVGLNIRLDQATPGARG